VEAETLQAKLKYTATWGNDATKSWGSGPLLSQCEICGSKLRPAPPIGVAMEKNFDNGPASSIHVAISGKRN
jgi:hypothetical protein